MRNIIEDFVTGDMNIEEFTQLFMTDSDVWDMLNGLIPEDAKNNPAHPLWRKHGYTAYRKYDFLLAVLLKSMYRFDGTLGDNLNIHSTVSYFYCYANPDIKSTDQYKEAFILFLDVGGDYFEGYETRSLLESIVKQCLFIKPKTKRKNEVKKQVYEAFHIVDRRRPQWIQGPEWPMGKNSPMKYMSASNIPDGKKYLFIDTDTNEVREVVQYY